MSKKHKTASATHSTPALPVVEANTMKEVSVNTSSIPGTPSRDNASTPAPVASNAEPHQPATPNATPIPSYNPDLSWYDNAVKKLKADQEQLRIDRMNYEAEAEKLAGDKREFDAKKAKLDSQIEAFEKEREEVQQQRLANIRQKEELDQKEKDLKKKIAESIEKAEQLDKDKSELQEQWKNDFEINFAPQRQAKQAELDAMADKARKQREIEEAKWKEAFEHRKEDAEATLLESLNDIRVQYDDREQKIAAHESEYNELVRLKDEYTHGIERNARLEKAYKDRCEKLNEECKTIAQGLIETERATWESVLSEKEKGICTLLKEKANVEHQLHELRRTLDRVPPGKTPTEFLEELRAAIEVYSQKHEGAIKSAQAIPEEIQEIQAQNNDLQGRLRDALQNLAHLTAQCGDNDVLRIEKEKLQQQLKAREAEIDAWKADQALRAKITLEEKESRISDIEKPLPQFTQDIVAKRSRQVSHDINEVQWLESIRWKASKYGTPFTQRMLYAFHTALKNAEFSPLTVLSGISGTGKSLLPSIYADFGGLNFISIPVQPNWDSIQSMLGFFNSLTGKFEAQPLLKFLAQTQLPCKDFCEEVDVDECVKRGLKENSHGLFDTMSIVLLDEMNLAHIELYFADFLSKLEERRGSEVSPKIDIPITAEETYPLYLGRNILWVGTMNQDETTKSLSDKVLDRGTVIDFPRPRKFKRREELLVRTNDWADYDETEAEKYKTFAPIPLLSRYTWLSWQCFNSPFSENDIKDYKKIVEDINDQMALVNRGLGHRVWQSIEMYMANYPTVRINKPGSDEWHKGMQNAFEDQLVQKVMPKLRGVETGGETDSVFEEIAKKLQEIKVCKALLDDFEEAISGKNYGQFVWTSSNYFSQDDTPIPETQPEIFNEGQNGNTTINLHTSTNTSIVKKEGMNQEVNSLDDNSKVLSEPTTGKVTTQSLPSTPKVTNTTQQISHDKVNNQMISLLQKSGLSSDDCQIIIRYYSSIEDLKALNASVKDGVNKIAMLTVKIMNTCEKKISRNTASNLAKLVKNL